VKRRTRFLIIPAGLALAGALTVSYSRSDSPSSATSRELTETKARLAQAEEALTEAKAQADKTAKDLAAEQKARLAADEKAKVAQEKATAATKAIGDFSAPGAKGSSEEFQAKMEALKAERDHLKDQLDDARQMSEILGRRLGGGSAEPAAGASNAPAAEPIPQFPWPPPKTSLTQVLPSQFTSNLTDLGDVDQKLSFALYNAGYTQRSYYPVPGGFAVVTRVEQFANDGSPTENGRWFNEIPVPKSFSLQGYQSGLFVAPTGHYRVVAFIVTANSLTQPGTSLPKAEEALWAGGGKTLPSAVASKPLGRARCTALVYEFTQESPMHEVKLTPTGLSAETHLQKSRIGVGLQ